jgi:hypothetical protein
MITRENKELRATIEELNDQNRIVLQNYHNHVKNVTKKKQKLLPKAKKSRLFILVCNTRRINE